MPGSSLLHSASDLDRIAADPAVASVADRFAPLRLALAPADDNPDPAHRDRFDTWGRAPQIVLGVPEGAVRDQVLEALWQALLLGQGWPEPAELSGDRSRIALDLLRATARARARSAGADAASLVADDLRAFCMDLDPEDPAEGLLARAWALVVPLGQSERAAATGRIAFADPDLADALGELLEALPEAPRTAAQALALADALARLP